MSGSPGMGAKETEVLPSMNSVPCFLSTFSSRDKTGRTDSEGQGRMKVNHKSKMTCSPLEAFEEYKAWRDPSSEQEKDYYFLSHDQSLLFPV